MPPSGICKVPKTCYGIILLWTLDGFIFFRPLLCHNEIYKAELTAIRCHGKFTLLINLALRLETNKILILLSKTIYTNVSHTCWVTTAELQFETCPFLPGGKHHSNSVCDNNGACGHSEHMGVIHCRDILKKMYHFSHCCHLWTIAQYLKSCLNETLLSSGLCCKKFISQTVWYYLHVQGNKLNEWLSLCLQLLGNSLNSHLFIV